MAATCAQILSPSLPSQQYPWPSTRGCSPDLPVLVTQSSSQGLRRWRSKAGLAAHRSSQESSCSPKGSKYLKTGFLPKTRITIPNIEAVQTPCLSTLDPWVRVWGPSVEPAVKSPRVSGVQCFESGVQAQSYESLPPPPTIRLYAMGRHACMPWESVLLLEHSESLPCLTS